MTQNFRIADGYRPCVGIMLINWQGLVFVGRRKNRKALEHFAAGFEWQMPQGGIDEGEDPYYAALRELQEETNVTSARLLCEKDEWLSYDLPQEISRRSWRGRFYGQTQKWFAFRFEGDDSEIDILNPRGGHMAEFDAWKWERMDLLPQLVIPFKRHVYETVVQDFASLIALPLTKSSARD